jgi:hypothetical protein
VNMCFISFPFFWFVWSGFDFPALVLCLLRISATR